MWWSYWGWIYTKVDHPVKQRLATKDWMVDYAAGYRGSACLQILIELCPTRSQAKLFRLAKRHQMDRRTAFWGNQVWTRYEWLRSSQTHWVATLYFKMYAHPLFFWHLKIRLRKKHSLLRWRNLGFFWRLLCRWDVTMSIQLLSRLYGYIEEIIVISFTPEESNYNPGEITLSIIVGLPDSQNKQAK